MAACIRREARTEADGKRTFRARVVVMNATPASTYRRQGREESPEAPGAIDATHILRATLCRGLRLEKAMHVAKNKR